ncbi:MFS transporter [Saccharothrix sp. S26]|uniref:MFS transporter n=1 Tax=Saccharothrix sp. S26 TaxID=2907215 RepID=UPI001F3D32C6|nr:MFS transporter [Saccharothrix sp. S26]MCE6995346.1 MFS transporter [Saccharothrix sp. S26]
MSETNHRAAVDAPSPTTAEPGRFAVAVLMAAAMMDLVNATLVNTALPAIGRSLQSDASALPWTISAYLLGFAGTLIISGHLGDRYGRRLVFCLGTALFAVTSLGCGLAGSVGELIAYRGVQGIAAAMIAPQVLGTYRTITNEKRRAAIFAVFGAVGGIAAAGGIVLGGVLVDWDLFGWGWRTIFLINVPIMVFILVGAVLTVPRQAKGETRPRWISALLLAAGLVAIVLPLENGHANGWPLSGFAWLAAGVLAIAGLLVVEARTRQDDALFPADVIRSVTFVAGLAIQTLLFAAMTGFFLVFSLWLQFGQGYQPTEAGLVIVCYSVGTLLVAPVAPVLAAKFGGRALMAGAVLLAIGTAWTLVEVDGSSAQTGTWSLVPGLVVAGAGLGQVSVPLVNLALSSIPSKWGSAASGIFATSQQVGSALGVAVVGTVYFANAHSGATDALVSTWPWLIGGFAATGALTALLPRRPHVAPATNAA